MSAGDCPRSSACAVSSSDIVSRAEQVHPWCRSGRQRAVQRVRWRRGRCPSRRSRRCGCGAPRPAPRAGRTAGGSACRRPAPAGASACPTTVDEALHAQHVMRLRRRRRAGAIAAPGRSTAGRSTTKLSKSSWSWPSSASWCEGRAARSSSAAAPRPSSTAASMRPSRVSTIFTARGHHGGDLAAHASRVAAASSRSALLSTTRSAQRSWSS